LQAGDVLGELSLLLGHPTTNAAIAATRLSVLEVDQQRLLALLAEDSRSAGDSRSKGQLAGELFKVGLCLEGSVVNGRRGCV
jgi:CRP-like cAMP-binding protein